MAKKFKILHEFRVFLAICTIAFTGLLISFGPSMAQLYESKLDHPAFLMTNVSLSNALSVGEIGDNRFLDRDALQAFYASRFNQPYWLSNSGPYSRAEDFMETLQNSWTHGLNPANYHVDDIAALMKKTRLEDHAQLELLLTDAFVRYGRDLSGIRINPAGFKILDKNSWRKQASAATILERLNSEDRFDTVLKSIEPQGNTYKLLRAELVRLGGEGDEPWASVMPIEFSMLMKPTYRHKSIPDLRLRLGAVQQTSDALLYDDALAAAVMKFQRENDLKDDGVIGSNTLQALNRTRKDKIHQVIANLERLRWVEEKRPEKFVVVNIPSYTLWAIDDGKVEFEMPVVVGRPVRPTQSFIADIRGVRFNPDWTVPPTIKKNDILPKLQEDPEYLLNKGIELSRGHGSDRETLDSTAVDWENITWKELNAMSMVQVPGAHNPLGQIRILMPNEYNIYLHDTNHPEHFVNPERAESSGCIRLKEPKKMAQFVMKGNPGWEQGKLESMLALRGTRDVLIEQDIPVYVLYYTAWSDEQGRIVYGNDIYKQDSKLIEALAKLDGFRIPGHNEDIVAGSAPAELVSVR